MPGRLGGGAHFVNPAVLEWAAGVDAVVTVHHCVDADAAVRGQLAAARTGEAVVLGTPVAAWDSGGVREWHPGGELLVPWGDVDGLVGALRVGPGQGVDPPCGFEFEVLVRRLEALYARSAPSPS